jgi:hypothetical protein
MTEAQQTIRDLEDKRQTLLAHQIELDEARSIAFKRARLTPKHGGTTADETNAQTGKIAAERSVVDSELASIEATIAEMTAVLPCWSG